MKWRTTSVSFQGGRKNVELLNSVSRANYTMLTFRRSVRPKDHFDVPVLLDRPQNIFWSVGFKNPQASQAGTNEQGHFTALVRNRV